MGEERALFRPKLSLAWDLFCISTLVGIWPRFIEPRLLFTTHLEIPFNNNSKNCHFGSAKPSGFIHRRPPNISEEKKGNSIRILQLSDLHFHSATQEKWIEKILKKVTSLSPDLVALTGDFLCQSEIGDEKKLLLLFEGIKAPLGVYAVLGNHDYSSHLMINEEGAYDIKESSFSLVSQGWKLLFRRPQVTGKIIERVRQIKPHSLLLKLFKQTGIEWLNNRTIQIGDLFNVTGLSEHMAGQADLKKAFANYQKDLPGIILVHNPDVFPSLKKYPGELVLSGHTHGGQLNLPWLWKRFTLLENPEYKSGLFKKDNKSLYVSRGLGSTFPFRLNAPPEIVVIDWVSKI